MARPSSSIVTASRDLRHITINDARLLDYARPFEFPVSSNAQTLVINNLSRLLEYDVLAHKFPNIDQLSINFAIPKKEEFMKDERQAEDVHVDFSFNSSYSNIRHLTINNLTFFSDLDANFIISKFNHIQSIKLTTAAHHLPLDYLVSRDVLQLLFIFLISVENFDLSVKDKDVTYVLENIFIVIIEQQGNLMDYDVHLVSSTRLEKEESSVEIYDRNQIGVIIPNDVEKIQQVKDKLLRFNVQHYNLHLKIWDLTDDIDLIMQHVHSYQEPLDVQLEDCIISGIDCTQIISSPMVHSLKLIDCGLLDSTNFFVDAPTISLDRVMIKYIEKNWFIGVDDDMDRLSDTFSDVVQMENDEEEQNAMEDVQQETAEEVDDIEQEDLRYSSSSSSLEEEVEEEMVGDNKRVLVRIYLASSRRRVMFRVERGEIEQIAFPRELSTLLNQSAANENIKLLYINWNLATLNHFSFMDGENQLTLDL